MVFSSLLFLFRFLPLVLLLYYIVPAGLRNLILLLVSLVFYAWGEPVYVFLMLASILISWTGGYLVNYFQEQGQIKRSKICMIVSVCLGLSMMLFFKYTDLILKTVNDLSGKEFPLLELAIPVGISFYTFQTVSYIIDVYRGEADVQKNIISYGAYVTMFPQLIAGPIVQYRTIDQQLRRRRESVGEFSQGVNRFVIGLGKKVLLANNAGAIWDSIRTLNASSIPAVSAWIGIISFTFQIYFDFSAYSDMAIGLGHMFGFTFLENFNYPYLADSVTEFWRRWHISLGTWFREYVYIPLGGNRRGKAALVRNIMVVWMLTGIWHGAEWNFLLWGLFYGILLLIEKIALKNSIEKLPAIFRHIYCMFAVIMGWVIFEMADITCGIRFFSCLFGAAGNGFADRGSIYLIYTNAVLLICLVLGSTRLPSAAAEKIMAVLQSRPFLQTVVRCIFYIVIFLLSTAYLVDNTYNPFLYFRF